MTKTGDPATYDDLVERLHRLQAWQDQARRAFRVGIADAPLVAADDAVAREYDRVRRLIRNHPDAPKAG